MKDNAKTDYMMVTQSLEDFGRKLGDNGELLRLNGSRIKKFEVFQFWVNKLKKGERLPRGRYFKNKKPGRTLFVVDEFNYF